MANTETLNPAALAQLKAIGFDDASLWRIQHNPEVIRQVNEFFNEPRKDNGVAFTVDRKRVGAAFSPDENTIYFPTDRSYLTYDTLVHELGHALGKRQPLSPNNYPTPDEYAKAVSIGEAEAVLNEYRIFKMDMQNPDIINAQEAFRSNLPLLEYLDRHLLKGRDMEQLPPQEQETVYNRIAAENAKMVPSSFGGYKNSLTYHEKSIVTHFMYDGQWSSYVNMMGKPTHQDLESLVQDEQIFRDTKTMIANRLYDQSSKPNEHIDAGQMKHGVLAMGGRDSETITGSAYDDKLLAGAGTDMLIGGKGNDKLHGGADNDADMLKGGEDNDTYYARLNDVIEDHEGKNRLFFDNREVKGQMIQLENSSVYQSKEGLFLEKQDNDLLLYAHPQLKDDAVRIKNFQNGDFGIELTDNPKPSVSQHNLSADSAVNLNTLSPTARKLYEECHQKLIALCNNKNITADNPQDFKNIAMAMTAQGIKNQMTKVDKMDFGEGTMLHILSYEPHAKTASVSANDVVNIPMNESMEKIRQTEQQYAQLAQERQMNQNQSQQRGMYL